MQTQLGHRVTQAKALSWITNIRRHLRPDEEPVLLVSVRQLRPRINCLAATASRLVAWHSDQPDLGFKNQVTWDNVAGYSTRQGSFHLDHLIIVTRDGRKLSFGQIRPDDLDLVAATLNQHVELPSSPIFGEPTQEPVQALTREPTNEAAQEATRVPQPVGNLDSGKLPPLDRDRVQWPEATFVGPAPFGPAVKTLLRHSRPGEHPWLVIHSVGVGVLAAFDDRVLLLKIGTLTSLSAGSLGGGRVTTFALTGITGVVYSSGLMTGVLEVLTPSYPGRAADRERAAQFAVTNTLPLSKREHKKAQPHLDELARRVEAAKRAELLEPAAVPPRTRNLPDELRDLIALRDEGVLSDVEFSQAKLQLLAHQGGATA